MERVFFRTCNSKYTRIMLAKRNASFKKFNTQSTLFSCLSTISPDSSLVIYSRMQTSLILAFLGPSVLCLSWIQFTKTDNSDCIGLQLTLQIVVSCMQGLHPLSLDTPSFWRLLFKLIWASQQGIRHYRKIRPPIRIPFLSRRKSPLDSYQIFLFWEKNVIVEKILRKRSRLCLPKNGLYRRHLQESIGAPLSSVQAYLPAFLFRQSLSPQLQADVVRHQLLWTACR